MTIQIFVLSMALSFIPLSLFYIAALKGYISVLPALIFFVVFDIFVLLMIAEMIHPFIFAS